MAEEARCKPAEVTPGLAAESIEPHELRDSVRLRAMVANGLRRWPG
jgi:hypothetical protein